MIRKLIAVPFLLISLTIFSSCNQNISNNVEKQPQLQIEKYLDTIPNSYEGYEKNSVIKEDLNEYLKTDFPEKFNQGIIEDLPLKLDKVKKCNSKYIAVLEHSLSSKYYEHGILDDLEMEFYAETDEETARNLIEGENYLIQGNFKEYLTFRNNDKYCALVLMAPFMGYQTGSISNGEIEFGAMAIKLDSISPYSSK